MEFLQRLKHEVATAVKGDPIMEIRLELKRSHLLCYGLRSHLCLTASSHLVNRLRGEATQQTGLLPVDDWSFLTNGGKKRVGLSAMILLMC